MSLDRRKSQAVKNLALLFVVTGFCALVMFQVTGSMENMAENNEVAASADNVYQSVEDSAGTAFSLGSLLGILLVCLFIISVTLRGVGSAFA